MIGRRFDCDRRPRRPRRRDGPPQGRLVLPDGAGHEPDADRRPHVHDRLHPRRHGAQRTRGARPRRVRGGADRERHHLSRRPDRAGQPGGLQHARARPPASSMGRHFADLVHPEDRPHRRRRPRRARRGRDGDAAVRGPLPAPRRADHRGERRRLGDPRRPAGGHPALHPDRGRHRCAPDDARARAVAVRDARPAGRGRRAPRRRHRPAYASGRRPVGEDRRAPGAARRPAPPRPARRRRCTTSARSCTPTAILAQLGAAGRRTNGRSCNRTPRSAGEIIGRHRPRACWRWRTS